MMISNDESAVNSNSTNTSSENIESSLSDNVATSSPNDESNSSQADVTHIQQIKEPIQPVNTIPSAYSWRVVPNYYSQQYHAPLIDFEANQVAQQQWHNEQIPQTAAYLQSQYVAAQPTTALYSMDPNSDLAYDHFNYQNMAYPNMAYNPIQHAWSSHPVIQQQQQQTNNNLTYPYDNTNSTSPNSVNSTSNKQYHYDNYYKDKSRPNAVGINSYHFVPNDPHLYNSSNNNQTNSIAQHLTTDNNGYSSNLYLNTQSYRRVNNYQSDDINKTSKGYVSNETDLNNNIKSRPDYYSKKTNKFNKNDENANSNGKKRYSDIVTGNGKNNNSIVSNSHTKATETSSSASPSINVDDSSRFNNRDKNKYDYNNSYNNTFSNHNYYSPFTLPHYNHYAKNFNYKEQFYPLNQYHDPSANLENEMTNLSLVPRFYPYNNYPYENNNNKKQRGYFKTNINDQYDPKEFYITGELEGIKKSRFFVIKSYSKDDVIHCIKYGVWCSTEEGNRKLDKAFKECANEKYASVYLFYSVNGSGQFCGMAQMMSQIDYDSKFEIWSQDKWQGTFEVNWIYVKDVPNIKLRHIILANNENKPVTNSRDTQEVYFDDAIRVLDVIRQHNKKSSILDEYSSELLFNQFDTNNQASRYNSDRKNKHFN